MPEPKNPKSVVVVTEIDQSGNQHTVVTEGRRFSIDDDGSLIVIAGDHDREIAAWARGQWVKVGTRLEGTDG